jgi:hypothetical protein
MRVLVAWMPLRWPYRTKFRVFTGKALLTCPYWISFYPKEVSQNKFAKFSLQWSSSMPKSRVLGTGRHAIFGREGQIPP